MKDWEPEMRHSASLIYKVRITDTAKHTQGGETSRHKREVIDLVCAGRVEGGSWHVMGAV